MNAGENPEYPLVADRPRGFNGIPEVGDLQEPDVTVAASHMEARFSPVRSDDRSARTRAGYAEWIAGMAVLGGTIGAIVGVARELSSRSCAQASARYPISEETKPHGDKLMPHGQR